MTPTEPNQTRSRWSTIGLFALLILGVLLTILFGLRAVRSFRAFHENRGRPPHEAMGDLAPWMSIPYVAKAYDVPAEFLFKELGIDPAGNERRSLMYLERHYFDGARGVIVERIRAALELYYAGSAVPTPIVPEPGEVPLPEGPPGKAGGPPPDAPAPEPPPDAGGRP